LRGVEIGLALQRQVCPVFVGEHLREQLRSGRLSWAAKPGCSRTRRPVPKHPRDFIV
jgi:hypothetical protein